MLYNSLNLPILAKRHGSSIIDNGQIQRYPLSNHMYWIKDGKPRGKILIEMNDTNLRKAYEKVSRSSNMCDTLFVTMGK